MSFFLNIVFSILLKVATGRYPDDLEASKASYHLLLPQRIYIYSSSTKKGLTNIFRIIQRKEWLRQLLPSIGWYAQAELGEWLLTTAGTVLGPAGVLVRVEAAIWRTFHFLQFLAHSLLLPPPTLKSLTQLPNYTPPLSFLVVYNHSHYL